MRLVEDDQAHVVEGDAFRPHVVPNHLGRRDDDLVLPPEEFAILGSGRLAREERDPVDDEDLPHRGRVWLDGGLGRREKQDPPATAPQDLRDDHRGDDRLAHSRRQDDEGRSLEARPCDVHLVRALLHGLPPEELVRHEHGGRTTQVSKYPLRQGGGWRPRRWRKSSVTIAMIPTIAVAPATMAVKIHVLLAWTVMESGREAIGPDPTTPEVSVALYVLPAAEAGTATTNESIAS